MGSHLETLDAPKSGQKLIFSMFLFVRLKSGYFNLFFWWKQPCMMLIQYFETNFGRGHTSRPYMHQNVTKKLHFSAYGVPISHQFLVASYATLYVTQSVGRSVGRLVGRSVGPKLAFCSVLLFTFIRLMYMIRSCF